MIYPNKINKGECIGVTATSAGLDDIRDLNKLENAIKNINNLGYKVIETPNVRLKDNFVSSSGKQRAEEFLRLWNDNSIKYIIAARGGEFLMEMIPFLSKMYISMDKPKWIQGFSDTSLLLFYLTTNFNLATIHASNFSTYGMKNLHSSLLKSIEFVSNIDIPLVQENYKLYEEECLYRQDGMELEPFNLTKEVVYKNLYNREYDKFEGRLIGGCIDVLKIIIGTEFDNTLDFCNQFNDGMIWYLENCEMSIFDFYRSLWQMKNAGWFKNSNGFLIGRTRANIKVDDFSYEDVLHNIFDDLNVPVIYDVDFGHVAPQWTMINGSYANFEYKNGSGLIKQELK